MPLRIEIHEQEQDGRFSAFVSASKDGEDWQRISPVTRHESALYAFIFCKADAILLHQWRECHVVEEEAVPLPEIIKPPEPDYKGEDFLAKLKTMQITCRHCGWTKTLRMKSSAGFGTCPACKSTDLVHHEQNK